MATRKMNLGTSESIKTSMNLNSDVVKFLDKNVDKFKGSTRSSLVNDILGSIAKNDIDSVVNKYIEALPVIDFELIDYSTVFPHYYIDAIRGNIIYAGRYKDEEYIVAIKDRLTQGILIFHSRCNIKGDTFKFETVELREYGSLNLLGDSKEEFLDTLDKETIVAISRAYYGNRPYTLHEDVGQFSVLRMDKEYKL